MDLHFFQALQPSKYYIVTFALFSNGEVRKPSKELRIKLIVLKVLISVEYSTF